MIKKEILDAYWFRHACKEFDNTQKIKTSDFDFILETARLSPSSFGFEPWHFLIVQKEEHRNILKKGAWGATQKLDTASHFVIALSMKSPQMHHSSSYLQQFMKEVQKLPQEIINMKTNFFKDFQKDDFNLNNDRSLFDWSSKQCYIALGNMMTSAAMIGIDSCPIEGFHQENTGKILARDFGIDTTIYGVSYMVAFGYRKNNAPEKTRRDLKDIITYL